MKFKFEINLPVIGAEVNVEVDYKLEEIAGVLDLYRGLLKDAPEIMEEMATAMEKFQEIDARFRPEEMPQEEEQEKEEAFKNTFNNMFKNVEKEERPEPRTVESFAFINPEILSALVKKGILQQKKQ